MMSWNPTVNSGSTNFATGDRSTKVTVILQLSFVRQLPILSFFPVTRGSVRIASGFPSAETGELS